MYPPVQLLLIICTQVNNCLETPLAKPELVCMYHLQNCPYVSYAYVTLDGGQLNLGSGM